MIAIAHCARYPVKSLRGESVEVLELDERGVAGDRWWALRAEDGKLGSGKSTRRFTRMSGLREMSSRIMFGVHTVVGLPDGSEYAVTDPKVHDAVSAVVGRPVTVVPEGDVPHLDAGPVHLVTTASLRWLAARVGEVEWTRLRPNLVVGIDDDERVEDGWTGRRVQVGTAELEITGPAVRCAMLGHAEGDLPERPEILRALAEHELTLGAYARVTRPGVVGTGDPLAFVG